LKSAYRFCKQYRKVMDAAARLLVSERGLACEVPPEKAARKVLRRLPLPVG